jgi:thiol-disulfide isomerase/thioredoxin
MRELNDSGDLGALLAGEKRTVVFFEMSGCPYCIPYKARFAELAADRPDLEFVRVRLDDPRDPLWDRYQLHAVPAFIAFEKGEIIARADSILAIGLSKRKWVEFREGI